MRKLYQQYVIDFILSIIHFPDEGHKRRFNPFYKMIQLISDFMEGSKSYTFLNPWAYH
ncbi:hypothetical protein [Dyadobacter endophyticus]|uniref:hypothetical protein n=1 Tax=Dyadobacter endophyticus TaxID=1749036 RepID=UPI001664A5D1|nr:hypothetical protein [Dyadobacter endophyticus]